MMNEEEIAIIHKYLDSLGATLWGRSFDINSVEGRTEAVDFIENLWFNLEEIAIEKYIGKDKHDGHDPYQ
jgi:hypothetical protein